MTLVFGFGAAALMLSAPVAEPMIARQGDMEAAHDLAEETALAGLVDRLTARLGDGAVLAPAFRQSWLPERSVRWARAGVASAAPLPTGPRPILLYEPPEPVEAIAELPEGAPARFVWRRVVTSSTLRSSASCWLSAGCPILVATSISVTDFSPSRSSERIISR